jgi:hypothetical protein
MNSQAVYGGVYEIKKSRVTTANANSRGASADNNEPRLAQSAYQKQRDRRQGSMSGMKNEQNFSSHASGMRI